MGLLTGTGIKAYFTELEGGYTVGFETYTEDLDLTPYFTAGQTSFEIDGRQTTVLPVVTWIGPDATAR